MSVLAFCILLSRKLTFIICISGNNNAYNLQNTKILHTILAHFDTTLSQIQLSRMHEVTSINVTKTIFGSDNKLFNSLLRRACHICHNTKAILVKYRCMRPHQYSCLQMLLLTNSKQCYRRGELLFLFISISVVILSRTCCQNLKNCISVVMSRELCNVSASTFICGIIFKMKGLKKLKFTSLKKNVVLC